ncbi:HTH_48 domain-containing protein [Nephila pilipes]|uniref:HTH_48 domain-containing protein n=1 Tax=Nephila pilipes TaxID=299642 RepID=A0A8X6PCX8_NEPPI|nr:HTH_48 domain-containing protein [Nephila pilipes]
MEKFKYRSAIKNLFLNDNATRKIKNDYDAVYGYTASSFTTDKSWADEYKICSTSLSDMEFLGPPVTLTTDDCLAKVHPMLLHDNPIKARQIAEAMKMSKERVFHKLFHYLDMKIIVYTLGSEFAQVNSKTFSDEHF